MTIPTLPNNARARLTRRHTIGSGFFEVDNPAPFGNPSSGAPVRITALPQATAYSPALTSDQTTIFDCINIQGNLVYIDEFVEGTADQVFVPNDILEVRLTGGILDLLVQGSAGNVILTGDVTGSGVGSVSTNLVSIGTSGTYTKVSTDTKGRVTSGGSLVLGDLPAISTTNLQDWTVTYAGLVHVSGSYADPAWLISLAAAKLGPVTATGTTTPRTLPDRAADRVNVRDLGAKGDGTTDDHTSLQAALDACPAGGCVWLPAGTYRTTLGLTASKVIHIDGYGATLLYDGGAGAALSLTVPPSTALQIGSVRGLEVVCHTMNWSVATTGLMITNLMGWIFHDVSVREFKTNIHCRGDAGGCGYLDFKIGYLYNGQTNFKIESINNGFSNEITVRGGTWGLNSGSGAAQHFQVTGQSSSYSDGIRFRACSFESSKTGGVGPDSSLGTVDYASGVLWEDCRAEVSGIPNMPLVLTVHTQFCVWKSSEAQQFDWQDAGTGNIRSIGSTEYGARTFQDALTLSSTLTTAGVSNFTAGWVAYSTSAFLLPSAGSSALNFYVSGEAGVRLTLSAAGFFSWGDGGGTLDVNMIRLGPGLIGPSLGAFGGHGSVPSGGTTNQFLTKVSGTDYDIQFRDIPTTNLNITSHYGIISNDTDPATGTVTFDLSASDWHTVTLTGSRTLALSNVNNGQQFAIVITQDDSGSHTVTWFNTITWMTAGGTAPQPSAAANKVSTFTFKQIGTGVYLGWYTGSNA